MSDTALLEVRELSKSFGALAAVSDLSFSAARGHITSVIGPNGAGKSTVFNLVSGALRPRHGSVAFAGADVTGWSTPRLLLIDEPTEGLAPMVVDEIFALIAELRAGGIPVLLVEQNVMRALEVRDRFFALERGAVVFEGRAAIDADCSRLIEVIAV